MKLKTLFTLNGVIAVGYAIAFFVATGPLLAIYGITPNAEAVSWGAGSAWDRLGLGFAYSHFRRPKAP